MPNIKPVSDLRNYNEVLREISVGEPVFQTKNARGKYVIIDIAEYKKTNAALHLLSELAQGEESANKEGWLSLDDLMGELRLQDV